MSPLTIDKMATATSIKTKNDILIKKYRNHYLLRIMDFKNGISNEPDHLIMELMCAVKFCTVLWDDKPISFYAIHPNVPKVDKGIDLISLDFKRVIQVKKYEGNSINFSDLSNFDSLAFVHMGLRGENIMLVTTETAKIDKSKKATYEMRGFKIVRIDFDDLMNEVLQIEVDKEFLKKPTKKTPQVEERDYLLDIANIVKTTIKKVLRFQLPCGMGKTFIMLYIIQQELKKKDGSRFIMFVPRIDLGEQTEGIFKRYGVDCVFISGKNKLISGHNVIICTNDSNKVIPRDIKFKYKFIDEAHHLDSNKTQRRREINSIKADKEINFSATFRIQKDLDYDYPMHKAIEEGHITDYILQFAYFSKGDRVNALVDMIKDRAHYFPMFVYWRDTSTAERFANRLKKVGVSADCLYSDIDEDKKKEIKRDIRNGTIKVLSLCGMYNEGVSIDEIRTVVFGDFRHQAINRIQIMMRACRIHYSKPYYRVIMPCNQKDLKNKDMKDVIKSICELDPRMKKAIKNRTPGVIHVERLQQVNTDGKLPDVNDCIEDASLLYEEIYDRLGEMVRNDKTQIDWVIEKLADKKMIVNEIHASFSKEEIDAARTSGDFKTTLHGVCVRLAKSGILSKEKVIDENGRKVWAYWITKPEDNNGEDQEDDYLTEEDTISDVELSDIDNDMMDTWSKPYFSVKKKKKTQKNINDDGLQKVIVHN